MDEPRNNIEKCDVEESDVEKCDVEGVVNEESECSEISMPCEVEYSPISGWLLVAAGLVVCGFGMWALTGDNEHSASEFPRAVRLAIDINDATVEELQILPRIGPALASRIVEYVQRHEPVTSLEQLNDIRGIGPRMIEELAPYLIFPNAVPDAEAVAVHEHPAPVVGRPE